MPDLFPSEPRGRAVYHAGVRRGGFTLVELLAVMAVISVLVTLCVPVIGSLTGSNRLVTAGNLVSELVSAARQEAMTKNTMTALVLLGRQGTTEDYRALTVVEYSPTQGWKQLSRWEILPPGIFVYPQGVVANSAFGASFLDNSPKTLPFLKDATGGDSPIFYKGQRVKTGPAYYARTFLPGGGLQTADQPAQLRMFEGVISATGTPQLEHAANYYNVSIVGSTGFPKIDRP